MIIVNIPNDINYHNLNVLSGFPVGSTLIITNNANTQVYLNQSSLAPSVGSDQYPLSRGKTVIINGNDIPVWIRGGSGPILVQSYDSVIFPSETIDPRVYAGLQAITTQPFTEANCKNGVQFEASSYLESLAAGASSYAIFITGDKPVLVKNRQISFTGKGITAQVFVSPTYSGGTPLPVYNLSRINPAESTVAVMVGATVNADGTQVATPTYGIGTASQGSNTVGTFSGFGVNGVERVIAPNSIIALKVTNRDTVACEIATYTTWYEGHLSSTTF